MDFDASLQNKEEAQRLQARPLRRAFRGGTGALLTNTLFVIDRVLPLGDAMLTYRTTALIAALMTLALASPHGAEARGKRSGSASAKTESNKSERDRSRASSTETATSAPSRTRTATFQSASDPQQAAARPKGQARQAVAPGPDMECADGAITRARGGCDRRGGVVRRR